VRFLFDALGIRPSQLKIGEMVCNDCPESSLVTPSFSILILFEEFADAL
jgi:hypothetical protein